MFTVSRWVSQWFDMMFKLSCCFVATVVFLLVINVDTTSTLKGGYENVHTYNYAATIRVGVDGHASEYQIDGILKIQRDKTTSNRYALSLSDLKHDSYYGVIDQARVKEYNPIDHDALQIPFYVTYNDSDHSSEIEYAKDEPDWSRKIKKSIASLFQVNWSIVKRALPMEGHANAYDVEEMTMHGECSVKYSMKKANQHLKFNEKYYLTKSYNLNGCDGFAHSIDGYITNDKFTNKDIQCSSGWNYSSIHNAYEFDIFNGSLVIEKIANTETYKFNDNADNVVVMKDDREFLVKIEQTVFFNDTMLNEQLFEDINVNEGHAFTSSNSTSPTGLVDKIKNTLLEALVYTKTNHLNVLDQDAEHKQLFNKLLSYLKRLEPDDFSFLESEIIKNPNLDKIRTIFISMLPYAGSKHSFDFTLDIITKKIISDDLAIDLLTKLPIYAPVSIDTVTEVLNSQVFQSESQLSPKVYESAILCYSQILSKFSNSELGDVIVENHLPKVMRAFEAASSTTSKLVFLSAIGNIRQNTTVKYILSILTGEQDVGARDEDRLRLAAINILSELISEDEVKNWAHSNVTTILKDDSESKPIRLAAYDFLISKSNYAIEQLVAVGQMISHDKDLYNYHFSTIEGLKRVGIIDRHAKFEVRHSGRATAVSSTLSKTVILKTDDLAKAELLKSTLNIQTSSRSFFKFSLVTGNQSTNSNWQIPSVVKLEVLEEKDKKLTVNDAIYLYTNFNGVDADDGVFIDFWTIFNRNTRAYYVHTIEFENLADILIMSDMLLQKIRDKLIFAYEDLRRFSVETGFGIDAVFEHKYPSLLSMHMDYNWGAEDNRIQAKVDFSSKLWSNGYHGVSVYNPFTGNTHSVRKTQQLDGQLLFSVIVKYDLTNRQFNLTIPVNSNDPEGMESGLSIYSSTSVGITDANDEISCQSCGFRVATTKEPAGPLIFRRKDYLGILASKMTYKCDSNQSFDVNNLLNDFDDDQINVINTCGFIAMIRPNASKPNSQIELLVNANTELSKSWENPWYFLPGSKMHFKSSIGSRQMNSNEFTRFLKLDFNASTSQGHFSNLLQFRSVKREDDDSNFILCYDGQANFPEIDDNHLPTVITQSKLTASSRIAMGPSKDESCSAVDFAIDLELIGEVSEEQRNHLKNYVAKSQCTLQQAKWLYIYVKEGEYPLTEACVREMISNTTLRRYKMHLKSDKFSNLPLLQTLLIIRNMKDKLEGIIQNSHSSAVDVEMISPITDIRTKKQMTFQASYPATGIYKNVPNIYFPREFVVDLIDKKINVINVYHEMIVYNNEEKPFSGSDDWKEICAGVGKPTYRVYAKVMHEDRMSFKIMFKGYELIMEPKLVSSTLKESKEPSYVPEIYYNQQLFSDFHQRLHLFSSQEILFSLSRVDDYMVVRSTEIPVTIYYTTDCINIFQRK